MIAVCRQMLSVIIVVLGMGGEAGRRGCAHPKSNNPFLLMSCACTLIVWKRRGTGTGKGLSGEEAPCRRESKSGSDQSAYLVAVQCLA